MTVNGASIERRPATGVASRMPETLFDQFWIEPLTDFASVNRTLNSLVNSVLAPNSSNRASMPGPAIDLYEKDGKYVIEAALPGYERDDIDIEVTDNQLTLSGTQRKEEARGDARYHYREVRRGSFSRTLAFPHDIDAEKVQAEFKNGILTVALPGSSHASPKKVAIAK